MSDELKLRIEETLVGYRVCSNFEEEPRLISVESDSQLIGGAVTRLVEAIRVVSEMARGIERNSIDFSSRTKPLRE